MLNALSKKFPNIIGYMYLCTLNITKYVIPHRLEIIITIIIKHRHGETLF